MNIIYYSIGFMIWWALVIFGLVITFNTFWGWNKKRYSYLYQIYDFILLVRIPVKKRAWNPAILTVVESQLKHLYERNGKYKRRMLFRKSLISYLHKIQELYKK